MLGVVIFLPAIYVFWLSFQQSTFGQAATFVGLANYAKVLGDPYFWRALLNTVIVVRGRRACRAAARPRRWRCCSPPACRSAR